MTLPFNYRGRNRSTPCCWRRGTRKLLRVSSEVRDPGCDSDALNFAALVEGWKRTRPSAGRLISILADAAMPAGLLHK